MDGEEDAQERLRQAQESRREAVEGVREAQEGVREMKEKVGDDSRQSSEVGRASGEGGRTVAERGRVSAEDLRGAAENVRELAEGERATAGREAVSARTKLKAEFYAIYTILLLCVVGAAYYGTTQDQRLRDATRANVIRAREGCARLNIVRRAQAISFSQQVKETDKLLKRPRGLKNLEVFRKQVIEQNDQRKASLAASRRSVADHPSKTSRYFLDCKRAYSEP